MRLFELDDRAVVLLEFDNAIVFAAGAWRPAGVYTARAALVNGTELTAQEFRAQFPSAATSLSKVDIQETSAKPN